MRAPSESKVVFGAPSPLHPTPWHGSLRWRHRTRHIDFSSAELYLAAKSIPSWRRLSWLGRSAPAGLMRLPSPGYTAAPDSITSTLLAAALNWGDAASMKRPTRLASP